MLQRLRVTVWDYVRRRTVLEFNPQDIKDRQHDAYELASAAAKLPEYSDRRAKLLSLRERCVAALVFVHSHCPCVAVMVCVGSQGDTSCGCPHVWCAHQTTVIQLFQSGYQRCKRG